MGTRAEDVVEHLIAASTHSYVLIFTRKGRVYWLRACEIPDAGAARKGRHISGPVHLHADRAAETGHGLSQPFQR